MALKDLDKIILVDDSNGELKSLVVVDLLDTNQRIKRMIPMLFAKMMYGEQKNKKGNESTSHLIIDEAHNILNANAGDIGDHWRDYRLDIFEEIIKEGRKFGFYVTLSSQRPADISPTIVSQVHNYFIHRLVNELDLRMIERTMPTLDRASFDVIPTLGKGECVVTGTAFSLPVFTVVDWVESDPRPHSDDLVLTDLWVGESNTDSKNQTQELNPYHSIEHLL
uniref:ATP-binding protein n=1 Tax=uncultured Rothia sp. TaxID=316088 RepID=UPI0025CF91DA|nr:ATP-binding protein [uncultured Rothia sp.]